MSTNHVMRNAAIVSALLLASFGSKSFAAGPIIDLSSITATMDNGTAKNSSGNVYGNTWYALGYNTASNTTGLATGLINGQTDPLSTYLIPTPTLGANNALMLDTSTKAGTITLGKALPLDAISFAGSSGNGAGTLVPTLHFSDGTSDAYTNKLSLGDWFNNTPIVETSKGRIAVDATTASGLFNNVGANNPRVVAANLTLNAADQNKFVTSIDLSWTGGANTHTAVFGISGDFTGLGHFSPIPLTSSSFNEAIILIPEPATLALFGLGAAGLLICFRRKNS